MGKKNKALTELPDPLPDIMIASYLGPPAVREKRLGFHLRQREVLAKRLPGLTACTLCSDYSPEERRRLLEHEVPYPAVFLKGRRRVWEKENLSCAKLYESKTLRAVLLLNDDVIPREPKDTDAENGLVDTAKLVKFWLRNPEQMAAQLVFFASSGLKHDIYYRGQHPVSRAPYAVCGWAMMVRSDLKVLQSEQFFPPAFTKHGVGMYDMCFRVAAIAAGKQVAKHNRAFFKTYQTIAKDVDTATFPADGPNHDRAVIYHDTLSFLKNKFPQAFGKVQKEEPKETGRQGFGFTK